MKRKLTITAAMAAVTCMCLLSIWVCKKKPRLWLNAWGVGVAFTDPQDGYDRERWTLRVHDGFMLRNGKWQMYVNDPTNGRRLGHYWWPRLRHEVLR